MLKTCGNCANGVLDSRITGKDLTKRICFGGPPSVVGVPMPGPGNTMRFSLQNARPAVDVNDRACGQWEPRSVIEGVISPVEGEKKETTQ